MQLGQSNQNNRIHILPDLKFIPAYQMAGYGYYEEYLKSEEWSQKKEWIKKHYPNSYYCWICDSTQRLNLHHEIYESIPKEKFLKDVFWICTSCHAFIHTTEKGEKVPLTVEALKQRRLYMRKRYLLYNFKPTNYYKIGKRLIFRLFW